MKRILILGVLLLTKNTWAWGAKGHEIVALTGSTLATEGQAFWQANKSSMQQLTTVPDRVWKRPSTKSGEGMNHWFHADFYAPSLSTSDILKFPKSYRNAIATYGENTIETKGTAPFRIRQLYNLAVDAFRAQDMELGLQYAGTMSHYIGDMSQPLHATDNYDGKDTGNDGIHKYFETDVIGDMLAVQKEVERRARVLLADPSFQKQFNADLMDVSFREVGRAVQFRDRILDIDNRLGRGQSGAQSQLDLAMDRMADGAATLAMVLGHLWRDTGRTLRATPIPVQDPAWVPPQFDDASTWIAKFCSANELEMEDDCDAE